jgi:uncharacterized membrane protein
VHKFLRAIGFSDIRKKDLETVLNDIIERPDLLKITKDSEGNEFAELTCEYAPKLGIRVCGTYEENDHFHMEYYYPYMEGESLTTQEQVEVQKHAEKESYAGICDDVHLGVTLIFYIQNVADYLSQLRLQNQVNIQGAQLSALSAEGMVLLPIVKRKEKRDDIDCKRQERSRLIAEARDGNEEAIESLTLEDMDTYSVISRRAMTEDVLSIVTSYFMPYGIESDQYAILGEILAFSLVENRWTQEQIYCMKIECNDLIFDVCINAKDLLGEPAVGRRFKGNVWMQGNLCL